MNPFEFLNNAIVNVLTGLTERYGTRSPNYVPPPQPRPTTSDNPFDLIKRAEEVVRDLNYQTDLKKKIIDKELGGY
jgi:hypothetical protein